MPLLKRTLERFVFHIKFVLADLGMAKAFWLGALKHKDLQGQEVSSQARGRILVYLFGRGSV